MSNETHSEKGLRELVAAKVAKWRRQAEKEVSTELKDKHYTIMVAMCEQMDRCADELEQALAATPAVREPGPMRLTEEQVRTTVLGLSWIPLNYRHDVLRNIMPLLSSSSAGEAAPATHKLDINQMLNLSAGKGVAEIVPAPAATEKGEVDDK